MGKRKPTTITQFDTKGMTNDLRSSGTWETLRHFRVEKNKLVPHRSTEADEDKTYTIRSFEYAKHLTNDRLYGMGVAVGGSVTELYVKNMASLVTAWGTIANGDSAITMKDDVLVHYQNYLYMYQNDGTAIGRWGDVTSSPDWTDDYMTVTGGFTNYAKPVIHPKDNILYLFTDNNVHKQVKAAAMEENSLTLVTTHKIVSAYPYRDYLAIGQAPLTDTGKSVLSIWDRDSSEVNVTAEHEVDGNIIAVGNGVLITENNTLSTDNGVIDVYLYNLNEIVKVTQIDESVVDMKAFPLQVFRTDNEIFVGGSMGKTGEDIYWGIYKITKNGVVSFDTVEEDANNSIIQNIFRIGGYWWISHGADGSVNRTNDQAVYSYTSIAETGIYGVPTQTKSLVGVTVSFEPLPSAGTVVLKYKLDNATTWSSAMKTVTTDSATRLSVTGRGVSDHQEIQFRVESTGGAIITGLSFTEEIKEDKAYT